MDDREALQALILASRRIHGAIDAIDYGISERLGLQRNDLRALNLLEDGPLTPKVIGENTGLTSGSVTALIDRLEKAGFVERKPSKTDRRSIEISLTQHRYAEIASLYGQCADSLMHKFGGQTGDQLKASAEVLLDFAAVLEEVAVTLMV
ncbi:MarR family transcriptional regulator [Nodosilinea sp. LEGE 07088]|uniref:MarR family winged helix-turn-helix transcriptional regulator n=1 Tax=Nodosilinea sp. LEGE 07088 TaxID=2777968 RepID=UPI00187F5B18|nr:MarR family transcriptional regulator [Nodosilinea sp. LEGE 07088]MBE9140184.1 MarR family transcriptional regulator [Nodosilinea sp. LEGE 07088]